MRSTKQITNYLLIILVGNFFFCSYKDTEGDKSFLNENYVSGKRSKAHIVREIKIDVSDNQYDYYTSNIYSMNNDDYFYGVDIQKSVLLIYNLWDARLFREIDLSFSPENDFGDVMESYIHNFDSIFLLAPDYHKVSLIDTSGTLSNQWNLRRDISNNNLEGIDSGENGDHFSYIPSTKELIIYSYPRKNPFTDASYYKEKIKLVYNIEEETSYMFGHYPEIYANPDLGVPGIDEFYATTILDSIICLSFPRSSEIDIYEIETKNLKNRVKVSSSFFSNTPAIKRTMEYDLMMETYISFPYFLNLLRDKNKYYRIVKLYQPYILNNNKYSIQSESPWSIIVCDSSFNVISECRFKSKEYDFNKSFMTTQGLIISKDSPSNKNDKEDYIEFDLIRIDI